MATTAKDVESAKKTAECVWVVEHATRCPDGGCGVAGCAKARKALTCLATRTVDASVSVSDIDAVRSVRRGAHGRRGLLFDDARDAHDRVVIVHEGDAQAELPPRTHDFGLFLVLVLVFSVSA